MFMKGSAEDDNVSSNQSRILADLSSRSNNESSMVMGKIGSEAGQASRFAVETILNFEDNGNNSMMTIGRNKVFEYKKNKSENRRNELSE